MDGIDNADHGSGIFAHPSTNRATARLHMNPAQFGSPTRLNGGPPLAPEKPANYSPGSNSGRIPARRPGGAAPPVSPKYGGPPPPSVGSQFGGQ